MRKRLCIISKNLPYPLSHGGAIAQYFFLENLHHSYDISFFTATRSKKEEEAVENLKNILPNIIFDYYRFPITEIPDIPIVVPTSNWINFKVAVHRLLTTIGLIKKVTAEPVNYIPTPDQEFSDFLKHKFLEEKYDIVQMELFEMLPYVDLLPAGIQSVFIHHEIRYKVLSLKHGSNTDEVEAVKRYEIEQVNKFNSIVVFNANDKNMLEEEGIRNISLSAFSLPNSLMIKDAPSETYSKFIFMGSSFHKPNYEAVQWFLHSIFLKLYDKMPVLYITGTWPEDFKNSLKAYEKIVFIGYVEDLTQLFNNAVLVSPIISGSGIRTKILQAFANFIPVFSTPIGAEGLIYDGNHLVLFDENNFESVFDQNFNDSTLRELALKGRSYFEENYDAQTILNQRIKIYKEVYPHIINK